MNIAENISYYIFNHFINNKWKRGSFIFLLLFISITSYAQKATIRGTVVDSVGNPISQVLIENISVGKQKFLSNRFGAYIISIPADTLVIIKVSHPKYTSIFRSFTAERNEVINYDFELKSSVKMLDEVKITDKRLTEDRETAGEIAIDASSLEKVPTPFDDFSQKIAAAGGMGIVSNNELSTSYSVRGGNFDENLVYVNNIQIYRPFLSRSGQQEGLSFVNSEMVESINFSAGGWQPKYGDKLSSVLNIQYKEPTSFGASLSASLLSGSLNLEGASKNDKFTFVLGGRYKSSEYLLNTLDTDGEYLPRFSDFQTYFTFDLSKKGQKTRTTTLGVLASYARNRYKVLPTRRSTSFRTVEGINNLDVAFDGSESLNYDYLQGGIKLTHRYSDKFIADVILSGLTSKETEFSNVQAFYWICDAQDGNSSNECVLVRGFGSEFEYRRNYLYSNIYSFESRNKWNVSDKWIIDFGLRLDGEYIEDQLHEYSFEDSVGIVQNLELQANAQNDLDGLRVSSYAQAVWLFHPLQTLTFGLRTNYSTINHQNVVSPRLQYSFRPEWKRDMIFSLAAGIFHQPPFYREMRGNDGILNTDLKAQSSVHVIAGMDYEFEAWDRPFKFISEAYYKYHWNVIPYDLDNIRVRYYNENNAVAYATGIDFRVSGEFIPGTQSWLGLSIMSSKEDVEGDGRGWIRRPTDQRVTFSMFFQDHIPNNPSLRMYMRMLYGSGFPFGPPDNFEQRATFNSGTDYQRVDIGFFKIINFVPEGAESSKFGINNLSLGLEVLNLLGNSNTISHTWVNTFDGTQYGVPNTLSQRFINVKMVLKH